MALFIGLHLFLFYRVALWVGDSAPIWRSLSKYLAHPYRGLHPKRGVAPILDGVSSLAYEPRQQTTFLPLTASLVVHRTSLSPAAASLPRLRFIGGDEMPSYLIG